MTADDALSPKLGDPMAQAYTVDTKMKLMTISHPNSWPAY